MVGFDGLVWYGVCWIFCLVIFLPLVCWCVGLVWMGVEVLGEVCRLFLR